MVLDVGTGDGAFVYQSAREDPSRFYIGIDAEAGALRETSAKALRKPEKGGVPNVLFLRAAAEALPSELDGVADEVHVHFPWGSLLRAVLSGDEAVLQGLRRVCAPGAWLEVVWALDPERDASELARLGLASSGTTSGERTAPREISPSVTPTSVGITSLEMTEEQGQADAPGPPPSTTLRTGVPGNTEVLPPEVLERYAQAGFTVTECGTLEAPRWPHLRTSWAKRLQGHRPLSYLIARAGEE